MAAGPIREAVAAAYSDITDLERALDDLYADLEVLYRRDERARFAAHLQVNLGKPDAAVQATASLWASRHSRLSATNTG